MINGHGVAWADPADTAASQSDSHSAQTESDSSAASTTAGSDAAASESDTSATDDETGTQTDDELTPEAEADEVVTEDLVDDAATGEDVDAPDSDQSSSPVNTPAPAEPGQSSRSEPTDAAVARATQEPADPAFEPQAAVMSEPQGA